MDDFSPTPFESENFEEARLFGRALREMRARRGLRQNEFCELSGLTATQASLFESGKRMPSLKTLCKIADTLDCSLDELMRPGQTPAREDTLPRFAQASQTPEEQTFAPLEALGLFRTTKRDPWAAVLPDEETTREMGRRLEDYRRLETICGAFRRASIPLALPFHADAEGAEQLASRVRALLGLGDTIILDYVAALENHGVRVVFLPLPEGLDSLSFFDKPSDSAFITIAENRNPEKQLFLIALELAYIYLYSRNGHKAVPETAEANRRFAKLFAACFLLPRTAVLSAAASLGAGRGDWSYGLVLRVKRHFGVSAEAFAYRLLELGLVDDGELSAILARIRSHYAANAHSEPGEALPALLKNGRLADLVQRALNIPEARDEALGIARRAGFTAFCD